MGLPLHTRKLRRVEIQPLIDKIGSRLPGWQGKLLSTARRETLKTVLSSQPIYHLTPFPVQKWLIKRIDKIRRSFLWHGEAPEKCQGRAFPNKLANHMPPKRKGGPRCFRPREICKGIKVEWLWFKWKHKNRAWNNLDTPCDKTDVELFNASTMVEVDNGKSTFFWTSSWVSGKAAKKI